MATVKVPSTKVPSKKLQREFRWMLNAVGNCLTKEDCLQIALGEGLPPREIDAEKIEFRIALLHNLHARGLFDPLNLKGLIDILKRINNYTAMKEVMQYMTEQRYLAEIKLYKNKKREKKEITMPENVEELIKLTSKARAKHCVQTTYLEKWESCVQVWSTSEDIDIAEIKKSCQEYVEILERSIDVFQRDLKRISASSLSSNSSNESDSLTQVVHDEVSAPTQESAPHIVKPVPLPRTRRCQSLSIPRQPAGSPTPLPRHRYSPPATPTQQMPTQHIEGATASESVATEDDFTGGTGDSGMGTGESDRLTWIQNSNIPPEEYPYELVGPSPESQRYTPLLVRRDIHDVHSYTQTMRTSSIEELIMAIHEKRRHD